MSNGWVLFCLKVCVGFWWFVLFRLLFWIVVLWFGVMRIFCWFGLRLCVVLLLCLVMCCCVLVCRCWVIFLVLRVCRWFVMRWLSKSVWWLIFGVRFLWWCLLFMFCLIRWRLILICWVGCRIWLIILLNFMIRMWLKLLYCLVLNLLCFDFVFWIDVVWWKFVDEKGGVWFFLLLCYVCY